MHFATNYPRGTISDANGKTLMLIADMVYLYDILQSADNMYTHIVAIVWLAKSSHHLIHTALSRL